MTQQTSFFPLNGTLNLSTPAISTPAGDAIAGLNYEANQRGYKRIDGFERFDGRPKPSSASYWVINFDAGTATIAEGAVVQGQTSTASGVALQDMTITSGSFGASNAAGYLVLTVVSGTFQDNENLQVSAVTKCVSASPAVEGGALNDTDAAAWSRDAIETARALIQAPAGSGPIRGVHVYNGDVYCVRDNVGATAGVLYKATASGWAAQALGHRVRFQSGTAAVTVGQTVTGASSAASGVVTRVVLQSGSHSAGTARGLFTFASITTGPFTNGENLQVGGVTKCVANGASEANTLPAGGRYEFISHNFYGASNLKRMYGANGLGTAFEWNGTDFVPIFTGMATDTPQHISAHKNHLFLSFPGGSAQFSGIGDPFAWSPLLGAGEIGLGEDITGFTHDFAGILVILGRNKIAPLYGSDAATWQLETFADDAGAIEWTAQKIGNPIYMDDRGLRDLKTTQAFGDFSVGAITRLIEPLFNDKRARGITPVASVRSRVKASYRVFFSDNTGISVYLGSKEPKCLAFDFGEVGVTCACSSEDDEGNEIMFFGADNGFVYQLDAGTSFDGESIPAFLRLMFNHVGSPPWHKRWHKAALEGDFGNANSIMMTAEFDYGDPYQPAASLQGFSIEGAGGFWDEDAWESFYWDAAVEGRAECRLAGHGRNCSLTVISESTYDRAHVLHGLTLFYTPRRLQR